MKKFSPYIALVLGMFACGVAQAQESNKFKQTAGQVRYVFNRFHYNPLTYDDAFSERVFTLFQKETDPFHSYLLQSQWDSLKIYEHKLDNELNGENSGEFLAVYSRMYADRWQRIYALAQEVYAHPLNYTEDAQYVMEHEKSVAFQTEQEWERHWRNKFKFGVLNRLGSALKKSDIPALPNPELEAKARLIMQKIYKKRTSHILAGKEACDKYLYEAFFQSVVAAYDPHSMFIPSENKDDFDQELNAVRTTFGIEVDENDDGEFYVSEVIPGSAAWMNGVIKSGDVLVKLIDKDKKETEFLDLTNEDVWDIFYQPEEDKITVLVKNANGEENTVTLHRETLKEEDGVVKSWILKGQKNIGYISLPGFYFDWYSENPSGCAYDVAREILKMRTEAIEGLILDVRGNGGGSFSEAVEMAGIFINNGPLLYTWEHGDIPRPTKDPNKGTIYDGPMILMINGESASASEVLADILQDYNRALIVGSPSFGKGTMQLTLPLDSIGIQIWETMGRRYYTPAPNTDYVNVTNGKLYRVTGKTHQSLGVTPDILLPDLWQLADSRESDYSYVLPADTIKGASRFKSLKPIHSDDLRAKSLARTSTEFPFTDYKTHAPQLKKMTDREGKIFPLQWDKFMVYYRQSESDWDEIDSLKIYRNNSVFQPHNNTYDAMQTKRNPALAKVFNDRMKEIATDAQLMETYRIMMDMIGEKKKRKHN